MFSDVIFHGGVQHITYVQTGGETVSYLRTAYINQGCFDDVSVELLDAVRAPDISEGGKVRWSGTGPIHQA